MSEMMPDTEARAAMMAASLRNFTEKDDPLGVAEECADLLEGLLRLLDEERAGEVQ